jgi:hypothetical protein
LWVKIDLSKRVQHRPADRCRTTAPQTKGSVGMADNASKAFVRNIAEVRWREFPNHFGGALSKPLVMPETAGSKHLDYRISM